MGFFACLDLIKDIYVSIITEFSKSSITFDCIQSDLWRANCENMNRLTTAFHLSAFGESCCFKEYHVFFFCKGFCNNLNFFKLNYDPCSILPLMICFLRSYKGFRSFLCRRILSFKERLFAFAICLVIVRVQHLDLKKPLQNFLRLKSESVEVWKTLLILFPSSKLWIYGAQHSILCRFFSARFLRCLAVLEFDVERI